MKPEHKENTLYIIYIYRLADKSVEDIECLYQTQDIIPLCT